MKRGVVLGLLLSVAVLAQAHAQGGDEAGKAAAVAPGPFRTEECDMIAGNSLTQAMQAFSLS